MLQIHAEQQYREAQESRGAPQCHLRVLQGNLELGPSLGMAATTLHPGAPADELLDEGPRDGKERDHRDREAQELVRPQPQRHRRRDEVQEIILDPRSDGGEEGRVEVVDEVW